VNEERAGVVCRRRALTLLLASTHRVPAAVATVAVRAALRIGARAQADGLPTYPPHGFSVALKMLCRSWMTVPDALHSQKSTGRFARPAGLRFGSEAEHDAYSYPSPAPSDDESDAKHPTASRCVAGALAGTIARSRRQRPHHRGGISLLTGCPTFVFPPQIVPVRLGAIAASAHRTPPPVAALAVVKE
jgi:hypothetical protein